MPSPSDAKPGFLGFIVGLGVGGLLGVLYAPKSGEETRQEIKDRASKTASDLQASVSDLQRQLDEKSAAAKEKLLSLRAERDDEIDALQAQLDDLREQQALLTEAAPAKKGRKKKS